MDLSLTETQTMLKNSAREFLDREAPRALIKEMDESDSGFSPELWSQMSDMGWVGLALQKQNLLPSIANGSRILAFAVTEPEYGWTPDYVNLKADQSGDNYILNGTKLFVPDAQIADQIIVLARTAPGEEKGLTMFLVDGNANGLSRRVLPGWTGDKQCELNFNNVEIPSSSILGQVNGGWAQYQHVHDVRLEHLAVASQGDPLSAQDAHHVHAGTGADMAYGMYLYTKKSKNLHSYLGDASHHKSRIAQLLNL